MDAWDRDYQAVMREQAVSVMIQESYVKEITRVKNQQLAAADEELKTGDSTDLREHSHGHALIHTSSSGGPRFATHKRAKERKGNSTLRRQDSNGSQLKEPGVKRPS